MLTSLQLSKLWQRKLMLQLPLGRTLLAAEAYSSIAAN